MKESIIMALNVWLTIIGCLVGFIGWALETIGNYTWHCYHCNHMMSIEIDWKDVK